jgi:hypothetical protein
MWMEAVYGMCATPIISTSSTFTRTTVFYRSAYIHPAELIDYWFICIKEVVKAKKPGTFFFDAKAFDKVRHSYSAYPERVEHALKRLALFHWERLDFSRRGAPIYPRVPFVLEMSDSLTGYPKQTPSFAELAKQTVIDPETDEEVGEQPITVFDLDTEAEQRRFSTFVTQASKQLNVIQQYGGTRWNFVETALGFLVKAFVTKDMDQLLWHITTVEAVLGENVTGAIGEKLRTRVANILGANKDQRGKIRDGFKDLYEIRSKLVHGDVELTRKEIYYKSLHQARYCARGVVQWAINYLFHIANDAANANYVAPERKALLRLLDMTAHERQESVRVAASVPTEFPALAQWTKIHED